jgi:nitroreductase
VEFADTLSTRGSCRHFRPDPIPAAVLATVLAATRRGPTAGNTWALDLIVIDEPARYWDVTLPAGPRRDGFAWPGLLRAPVLVIPVVDPAAYVTRYAEPEKAPSGLGAGIEAWSVPYWWVDAGAAVMALLLAATDAGLGSLLFGQFRHTEVLATTFGIPEGRHAVGTVALGHRAPGVVAAGRSAARRRPPLDDIVHLNGWKMGN